MMPVTTGILGGLGWYGKDFLASFNPSEIMSYLSHLELWWTKHIRFLDNLFNCFRSLVYNSMAFGLLHLGCYVTV